MNNGPRPLLPSRITRSASRTSCIPQRSSRTSIPADLFSLRYSCVIMQKIILTDFPGGRWSMNRFSFSGLLWPRCLSGLHFIPPSQLPAQSCKACTWGIGWHCELHSRGPHRFHGTLWESEQSLAHAAVFCSVALLHKVCISHLRLPLHGVVLPLQHLLQSSHQHCNGLSRCPHWWGHLWIISSFKVEGFHFTRPQYPTWCKSRCH